MAGSEQLVITEFDCTFTIFAYLLPLNLIKRGKDDNFEWEYCKKINEDFENGYFKFNFEKRISKILLGTCFLPSCTGCVTGPQANPFFLALDTIWKNSVRFARVLVQKPKARRGCRTESKFVQFSTKPAKCSD